jgi:Fe-S cluster assembly protein SufD
MTEIVTSKTSTLLSSGLDDLRARWTALPGTDHPVLSELRQQALAAIEKSGLPSSKSEEYKHMPVTRVIAAARDQLTQGAPLSRNEYTIPDFDCHTIVLRDGRLDKKESSPDTPGLRVSSLRDLLQCDPDSLADLFRVSSDPFANWNLAVWEDGVFIEGVCEKPVCLLHLNSGKLLHTRVAVRVPDNGELSIVERFVTLPGATGITNYLASADGGKSSKLTWVTVQDDSATSYLVNNVTVRQQESSVLNFHTHTLGGALVRNNLTVSLEGEQIESHLNGLYVLSGRTLADNHTVVDHRMPNSVSNELYKGIMDGDSRGVFNGKIYVRPQAQKTNAFQSNRNIILSETAQVHTKPQLEIWADDVKCSHGCTSGQLDDEALFYLRSRGITREGARAMLLEAFAGEVLDRLPFEAVRNFLHRRIMQLLHTGT